MYVSFKHDGKDVDLDLSKPVRVKLGSWADHERRVWIYSQVDLQFWQNEDGSFDWHAYTLTRERLLEDGTFRNQDEEGVTMEVGDAIGQDIDEFLPQD